MKICEDGISTNGERDRGRQRYSVTACLWPPSELGWHPKVGGGFKGRIAELMGMEPNDVQAMVICGVPTSAIDKHAGRDVFTLSEPAGGLMFFELVDDDVIYSKAHIAKVWTLEPTALADARQALVNIRAGEELKDEFEGKTVVEVEQQVERLEEQFRSAAESTSEPEPEPAQRTAVRAATSRRRRFGCCGARAELDERASTTHRGQLEQMEERLAAKDAELEELRARLEGASSHDEGVPPK
eukprot:COSAG04_NODE_267_length_18528_cov_60.607141_7_plen_242_part_00